MKKFIFILVGMIIIFAHIKVTYAAEIYLFIQHSDVQNSKANEYVDLQSRENLAGLGFSTHVFQKDRDKLELKAGLGKSKADIFISQTVKLLGKTYSVQTDLNYRTVMYLFNISYSYYISKAFLIQVEFEQSKNILKRNTYTLKLAHEF